MNRQRHEYRVTEAAQVVTPVIHAGQRYDGRLSGVFFSQLALPKPDVDLVVGSGAHGQQAAAAPTGLEQEFAQRSPAPSLHRLARHG